MKSLNLSLLTLLLITTSCGKNHLIGDVQDQAVFSAKEESNFFTILDNHELRRQMLNSFVDKSLSTEKFNPSEFTKSHLNVDSSEFRNFSGAKVNSSKKYARLFVSYSDRTEIYYIPEKTDLNSIEKSLGLEQENFRYYSWLITDDAAVAQKDYVLVSLNHSDLMENDTFFFEQEIHIQEDQELIEVVNGSILNVEIDYEMLKQSLKTTKIQGSALKCSRDILEAMGCSCDMNIMLPDNSFVPTSVENFEMIDFDFKINDELVKFNQMVFDKIENNKISFNLAFPEHYNLTPTFQLVKKIVAVPEVVHGFNYDGNCKGTDKKVIHRQLQSKLKVKYKILGRGESLKNIKL